MLLCTHPSNFSILHSNWVTAIQSICLLLVVYKMKYDILKKILFVSNNLQACCCSQFLYENLNLSCCLCQPISEPSPFLGGSVNYITSHCSLGMCALPCWGLFSLASQICSNMFFVFFPLPRNASVIFGTRSAVCVSVSQMHHITQQCTRLLLRWIT